MTKEISRRLRENELWIFDADDTLWESALYFRRAEEAFIALMESLGFSGDATREEVRRRDIERLSVTGYGGNVIVDHFFLVQFIDDC